MAPNIFKYATKELTQDAVICWLVACAREATGELRECGLNFVQALMQSGGGAVIDATNGELAQHVGSYDVGRVLGDPKRQYQNIDVFFQATVDDKVVSFVIEDKTDSEMSGNQLERYMKIVKEDDIREDLIKPVYFKTGYVFHDEREKAESARYSVFDGDDTLAFFSDGKWVGAHEFLRQFAEHVACKVDCRRRALNEWKLKHSFVQWEFMVRLGEVLQLEGKKWPARWFNVGGSAWTQYPHWDGRGALYWRLDSWKPLRLMVGTHKAGEQVLHRWDGWSQAFEEARKESGLNAGKFRRVTSRGGTMVREGTIGAVEIASCLHGEGLERCVARVARLYRAFVASVGSELS